MNPKRESEHQWFKSNYIYVDVCNICICNMQSWAHRSLKSLFALERTFILGAMVLSKKKSDVRTDIIQIMSGLLMSDIRTKERSKNG